MGTHFTFIMMILVPTKTLCSINPHGAWKFERGCPSKHYRCSYEWDWSKERDTEDLSPPPLPYREIRLGRDFINNYDENISSLLLF